VASRAALGSSPPMEAYFCTDLRSSSPSWASALSKIARPGEQLVDEPGFDGPGGIGFALGASAPGGAEDTAGSDVALFVDGAGADWTETIAAGLGTVEFD